MASIGILLSGGNGCAGIAWRKSGSICPTTLRLEPGTSDTTISVDFSGRGKIGALCATTGDAYVSCPFYYRADIDVWKARADGVWSSSVTIDIYMDGLTATSKDAYAYPLGNFAATVLKSITRDTVNCGTSVKATVTVNSDGTFSIA